MQTERGKKTPSFQFKKIWQYSYSNPEPLIFSPYNAVGIANKTFTWEIKRSERGRFWLKNPVCDKKSGTGKDAPIAAACTHISWLEPVSLAVAQGQTPQGCWLCDALWWCAWVSQTLLKEELGIQGDRTVFFNASFRGLCSSSLN